MKGHTEEWSESIKAMALRWLETDEGQEILMQAWADGYDDGFDNGLIYGKMETDEASDILGADLEAWFDEQFQSERG